MKIFLSPVLVYFRWSLSKNFLALPGDAYGIKYFEIKTKPSQLKLCFSCRTRAKAALSTRSISIEVPRQWYNLVADLPIKPPPPLHPKTFQPIKPEDLSPLFCNELIKQEASIDQFIDIPEEVLDVYSLWRPTPLIRFVFCFLKVVLLECQLHLHLQSKYVNLR